MKLSDEEIKVILHQHTEMAKTFSLDNKSAQAIRQLMEERDRYKELLKPYIEKESSRVNQFVDANIGSKEYELKQALGENDADR